MVLLSALVILTGCGEEEETSIVREKAKTLRKAPNAKWYVTEADNHEWFVWTGSGYGNSILHHPDCPCDWTYR